MPLFSRKPKQTQPAPSDRYKDLLEQYKIMHADGDPGTELAPQDTFNGRSILNYADSLKSVMTVMMPQSALDYGSGKGLAYTSDKAIPLDTGESVNLQTFLGLQSVTCYDPAYPPFMVKPVGKFDCVISTDVLEHCPEEDIGWILGEIFSYARDFVFLSIAGYPAKKSLPSGENAHITLKPKEWWKDRLDSELLRHRGLRYFAVYDTALPLGKSQTSLRGYYSPDA